MTALTVPGLVWLASIAAVTTIPTSAAWCAVMNSSDKGRPGSAIRLTWPPDVAPQLAVPVAIFVDELQPDPRHE